MSPPHLPWIPMLPPSEPIDPHYTCSNLHLSHIELGVGFVTFWGKGDVTRGKLESAVKFRDWFAQVYPRLPTGLRRLQGTISPTGTPPKTFEEHALLHNDDHTDPKDLDHFHVLYPNRLITAEDVFHLRLLLSNLGWVMPIVFKDYIVDGVAVENRNQVYVTLEDGWLEIMSNRGIN